MLRYIFSFWPWKQSRYSSFCGAVVTWMMEMGKLWEDAAKTAEARVTSFLSKNSAQRIFRSVRQLDLGVNSKPRSNQNEFTPASSEFHPSGEKIGLQKTLLAKWHLSGEMIYLPERTASSQSRRICWYQWWCCSQWSGCSYKVLMFRSPAKKKKKTKEKLNLLACVPSVLVSQANPPFWCRTCSGFRYVEELWSYWP